MLRMNCLGAVSSVTLERVSNTSFFQSSNILLYLFGMISKSFALYHLITFFTIGAVFTNHCFEIIVSIFAPDLSQYPTFEV